MKSLYLFEELFCIFQLHPSSEIPVELMQSSFFSVLKDQTETSIIAEKKLLSIVPERSLMKSSVDWRLFRLEGVFDFDESGVLLKLIQPLSANDIGIMALSSFNTDFLLIQNKNIHQVLQILSMNYKIRT